MKTTFSEITIPVGHTRLMGNLNLPDYPKGLVIFAHGSGSSRFSPRNRFVADVLNSSGFATLLVDLLSALEDEDYSARFDIDLLTARLIAVTEFMLSVPQTAGLITGYFGASTGAASALMAAAALGPKVGAIVSRGGRPDLAAAGLPGVQSPVLLLVGSLDLPVISMNREAFSLLKGKKKMVIIEGATHLFEEPGKLEEVAGLATQWFEHYLVKNDS